MKRLSCSFAFNGNSAFCFLGFAQSQNCSSLSSLPRFRTSSRVHCNAPLKITPFKISKSDFYGLGGKYRNSLTFLPGWGGLRWGDWANKVHQKSLFVQFEFINFRPNCHPEFISGSNQNVVNTPKWQDAETSSAWQFYFLLPTKTDNKIQVYSLKYRQKP